MYAYLPSALFAFLFKQLFKITELKRINKYSSRDLSNLVNFYVTYTLSLLPILRLGLECPRSQSLQPRMQVDIFLLQRGLESRTTCSQTFMQNVSVESYTLSAQLQHNSR